MNIRLTVYPIYSYRGEEWPALGTVLDLPEGIARDMVQQGFAEPCSGAATLTARNMDEGGLPIIEAAVIAPPENAAKRTSRPKGR